MPVSAVSGDQVQLLADLLVGLLPEGPPLYPDGDLTDAPEEALAADLIREAALEGVRDELPHSIAVVVEEMGLREGRPADKPLLDIVANLYVERDSQKGIMIGHKGARLRVGRHGRPQADRGAARHAGLPRPPGQDRQGLAARPASAAQARLLTRYRRSGRLLGEGPDQRLDDDDRRPARGRRAVDGQERDAWATGPRRGTTRTVSLRHEPARSAGAARPDRSGDRGDRVGAPAEARWITVEARRARRYRARRIEATWTRPGRQPSASDDQAGAATCAATSLCRGDGPLARIRAWAAASRRPLHIRCRPARGNHRSVAAAPERAPGVASSARDVEHGRHRGHLGLLGDEADRTVDGAARPSPGRESTRRARRLDELRDQGHHVRPAVGRHHEAEIAQPRRDAYGPPPTDAPARRPPLAMTMSLAASWSRRLDDGRGLALGRMTERTSRPRHRRRRVPSLAGGREPMRRRRGCSPRSSRLDAGIGRSPGRPSRGRTGCAAAHRRRALGWPRRHGAVPSARRAPPTDRDLETWRHPGDGVAARFGGVHFTA